MTVVEPTVNRKFYMDRDSAIGNSNGADGRARAHVKVANKCEEGEAIPTQELDTECARVKITKEFNPDAFTKLICKTFDETALDTDAVWQIERVLKSGQDILQNFADVSPGDGKGNYDQICNNRLALFGNPPYVNDFSTQFDGSNDCIVWPTDPVIDFDNNEAFSGFYWLKSSDLTAATMVEKTDSNTGYRFYYNAVNLTFEFRATGVGDRIRVRVLSVRDSIQDGDWHQIGWTFGGVNAAAVNIYIDGVAQTIDVQNDTLVGSTLNVGDLNLAGRPGNANNWGPGNIDEFAIWDVELTPSEVTTIYNLGVPIDLQNQSISPITTSLRFFSRQGDGPADIFPTIQDVESLLDGDMVNMSAGDIEGVTPP